LNSSAFARSANRLPVTKEKAALARGSFIVDGQKFLRHYFFLPITQVQILLDFSAFVPVF
jgi:hypothetical protein